MPGLHVGQTWTEPVYNPLNPEGPLDVLQARVDRHDTRPWNGQAVDTVVVVYSSISDTSHAPRGVLWVDREGNVLRQEMALPLFDSRLVFDRIPPDEVARRDGLPRLLRQELNRLGNAGPPGLDDPHWHDGNRGAGK